MHQGWFRALPVRRWLGQRRQGKEEPLHLATYLLVQASQRFWLAGSYDVYQQFTWVSHAIHTWPPTAVALAVVRSSRERPGHPDRVRLRCPKSFAPSDYSGRTSWWGTSGRTLGYVLVVRPVITGTSAASCHNLPGTKLSNPKPQRRGVEQKTRIMPRLFSGDSLSAKGQGTRRRSQTARGSAGWRGRGPPVSGRR